MAPTIQEREGLFRVASDLSYSQSGDFFRGLSEWNQEIA